MAGGRPPLYTNPDEMQTVAEQYFSACDLEERPYTVTGLARALGFSRQAFLDYENKGEFLDTVKGLKARVEQFAEERLYGTSVTGVIFSLKNNYGWKDQSEVITKNEHRIADDELNARLAELLTKAGAGGASKAAGGKTGEKRKGKPA